MGQRPFVWLRECDLTTVELGSHSDDYRVRASHALPNLDNRQVPSKASEKHSPLSYLNSRDCESEAGEIS